MNSIAAIVRKELAIYFTTVVGYASFGAFAFLMGLVFISTLNRFQQYTAYAVENRPELLEALNFNQTLITPMLSTGLWMFLFFVPFLTMRLFAEEKSARTFELLMTTPITSLQMVLGKFFGVSVIILLMSLFPLIFPLLLSVYGTTTGAADAVEWSPVLSGSFLIFLLGLLFSAVGLLISALSESQIVSAILTFAALLLAFVLPLIASRIEGDWRLLLEYLTPVTHTHNAVRGRLLLSDLTYFITTISLVLFLTTRVVESHRWR